MPILQAQGTLHPSAEEPLIQQKKQNHLELQLNSKFWQLLSNEELQTLSELRRKGSSVERIIPLEFLYPNFQALESVDSRNDLGKVLEAKIRTLDNSYIKLEPNGKRTLFLNGQIQQNPQQVNIYGESWPETTLRLWLEEDSEWPFLLSELETYQRFHNIKIDVQVWQDLLGAVEQFSYRERAALPDMILAGRKTLTSIRGLFAELPVETQARSIALLELFAGNEAYYSVPVALESYVVLYNPQLMGTGWNNKQLPLSDFFDRLGELNQTAALPENPYFLGFGEDILPFTLILHSFMGADDDEANIDFPNIQSLEAGLQYVREQGRKGLLQQLNFVDEQFASGNLAAIVTSSGKLQNILALVNNTFPIEIARIPFNDFRNNHLMEYLRIWGLGILNKSSIKPRAIHLRNYLLRGVFQGNFDLRQGILPSNTSYYPFYQRSVYYPLLPKAEAELRPTMSTSELWEYGIKQRNLYQKVNLFNHLFSARVHPLLLSDVPVITVLTDIKKQWEQEVIMRPDFVFLR